LTQANTTSGTKNETHHTLSVLVVPLAPAALGAGGIPVRVELGAVPVLSVERAEERVAEEEGRWDKATLEVDAREEAADTTDEAADTSEDSTLEAVGTAEEVLTTCVVGDDVADRANEGMEIELAGRDGATDEASDDCEPGPLEASEESTPGDSDGTDGPTDDWTAGVLGVGDGRVPGAIGAMMPGVYDGMTPGVDIGITPGTKDGVRTTLSTTPTDVTDKLPATGTETIGVLTGTDTSDDTEIDAVLLTTGTGTT
jgi:hypothetical protein